VDTTGRPPLRPFDPQDIPGFIQTTRQIIQRINPQLAEQFQSLADHNDLDLESRTGKRPGGFQSSLEYSRRPFIFMNAAGVQRDADTLLHEAGHAFHDLASTDIANLFARHAPIEFCEVASMSMELLAMEHMDLFYDDPADADRARRHQLEGVVKILPWVATIDGFQHWLYTHPGHSPDQRGAAWGGLIGRFAGSVVDWREFETARQFMWHRQMHLFHAPFYYIEYAIAQLGALQVWRNYRQDKRQALDQLRHAFALGGTRPLPELFAAAGIALDFSQTMLGDLLELVGEQLRQLESADAR
jgi:oligoendopeptidase F